MAKPTLQTIADIAGVSKMTVSRCLRNHPNNSAEMKRRIHEIAEKVGYRPNPMVSSLMQELRGGREKQETSTVIAVLDDYVGVRSPLENISWNEHLEGMRHRSEHLGYKLEIFRYREEGISQKRLSQILWARNVRGVIVPHQQNMQALSGMDLSNFVCVAMGYTVEYPAVHRVCPDFYEGMNLAIDKIKETGLSRVLYVTNENAVRRTKGKSLAAFLMRKEYERMEMRHMVYDDAYESKRDIESLISKMKPEVVVSNHPVVPSAIKNLGLGMPQDVRFIQLNWTPFSVPYSGVKNRNRLQGEQAVDIVNAKLVTNDYGIPKEPVTHLVKNEWVEGETFK